MLRSAPPKPKGAARLPSGIRHTPPAATHALRGGVLAHEHPTLWYALHHPRTRERETTTEAGRSGPSSRRGTVMPDQETTAVCSGPGSDIHVMLALRRSSREVVVTPKFCAKFLGFKTAPTTLLGKPALAWRMGETPSGVT